MIRVVQMLPGPTPTLMASAPRFDQGTGGFGGGDVAHHRFHFRKPLLHLSAGFYHSPGMAVGGINADHIRPGSLEHLHPFQDIGRDAYRRPHAQATKLVLRGIGAVLVFQNVFVGNQPTEAAFLVDDGELFNLMFLQNPFGSFQPNARFGGDQRMVGHHLTDRHAAVLEKP